MYALVDCNNFYVSCERLFNPAWHKRPVVVLSNNDGCAIARSEEAKALGIKMGAPEFMIKHLVKEHGIVVRSSNYTLYGDMSGRVMRTLASFVPRIELYSIDEAFLDMHAMQPHYNLQQLALKIKKVVGQCVGIPVSIGIAPTKTLAKMANRYAKKNLRDEGVFFPQTAAQMQAMLACTPVEDIWGIGSRYAAMLHRHGLHTAADLKEASADWVREHMTVVGERLLNELRGIPAIAWEFEAPKKKNICTSRSFGRLLTDKNDIRQALTTYAARCAEKLRRQDSCCRVVHVFLHTNAFRTQDRQYSAAIDIQTNRATNDTGAIVKYASRALDLIFRPGFNYVKCGCIVMGLVPAGSVQNTIFGSNDTAKKEKLMQAMDKINQAAGVKDMVRMAAQGFSKPFALRADHLSKRFTTNINEILLIK